MLPTPTMAAPPSASQQEYLATCPLVPPPTTEHACPICYEDWNAETEAILRTHCGHIFHRECLTAWFGEPNVESANSCPSCRSECFPGAPSAKDSVVIAGERTRNIDDVSFLYEIMYQQTARPKRLQRTFDQLSAGSASLRSSLTAPFKRGERRSS